MQHARAGIAHFRRRPSATTMKTRPRKELALLLLAVVGAADAVLVRASQGSAATSASASISAVAAHRFGPKQCVTVDRSSSGSCVIKTACHGLDTSAVEFAFDCWAANGDIFRHSFGVGGFAEQEDFDSEVQCAQCHPPSDDAPKKPAAPIVSKPTAKGAVSFTKKVNKKAGQHPLSNVGPLLSPALRAAEVVRRNEENYTKSMTAAITRTAPQYAGGMGDLATERHVKSGPSVSRYGPQTCVSTWRNAEGHCVLQTACQNVDISSYEFGLVCVDAKGLKTKHTFGRGSFDVSETFDTLAECSECIGLDDQRVVALRVQKQRFQHSEEASEVATLSEEVSSLTKTMTSMLGAVMTLRQKVKADKKVAPAPDPAAATLAAWSGEDQPEASIVAAAAPRLRSASSTDRSPQSIAQVKEVKKKHHHHHRKVVEEEEDEDEDDDDDDNEEESGKQGARKSKATAEDTIFTPATNGIGEVLDEGSEAEASELSLASDGQDSAGAMDDGSYGLETGW